jgi:CMP-N-acetylneuraminic acid synthetase
MEQNSLYGPRLAGWLIDPSRSVNLDTLEDWRQAEERLRGQAALA